MDYPSELLFAAVEDCDAMEVLRIIYEAINPTDLVNAKRGNDCPGTPLHVACARGCLPIVTILVGEGADVNDSGDDGPPLISCIDIEAGTVHADIVRFLLAVGADPARKSLNGITFLGVIECLDANARAALKDIL